MRVNSTVVVLCALILSVVQIFPGSAYNRVTQSPQRTISLSVRVVLVGIDRAWVDTDLMTWNTCARQLIPQEQYQTLQITGAGTGILFKLSYDIIFAAQSFRDKYVQFLKSIEVKKKIENPCFTFRIWNSDAQEYEYTTHECTNVLYDAVQVEEWLYQNREDYGGLPTNGWAFIITYLPELPFMSFTDERNWGKNPRKSPLGTPHYYSISVADFDGGYRYEETEFMKGWGGKYRQFFVDLSAGPIPWTEGAGEGWGDSPLQWALEDFDIKLGSTFGRTWLTNYLASYIWEGVRNFVVPDFCYDPPLADEYELAVFFLDHRTSEEKSNVNLENLVNKLAIKAAYDDLCPYVKNTVTLSFKATSDFEGLTRVIEDSRLTAESIFYSSSWDKQRKQDYVNLDPVYKYLQTNIGKFVGDYGRDAGKVTLPVFVFVFSGSLRFYRQWKWFISDYDRLSGSFNGVALGDFAIIGQPHNTIVAGDRDSPKQPGKRIGFTHSIIHEVGHMVGLVHPHSYAPWGDFSLGAMSYFTSDVVFGQHDKDALRRGHVDKLMIEAGQLLNEMNETLGTRVKSTEEENLVAKAEELLRSAESDYAKMQYCESLGTIKNALTQLKAAMEKAKALPTLGHELQNARAILPVTLTVGIAIGVGVGFVVLNRSQIILKVTKRREGLPRKVKEKYCSECGWIIAMNTKTCPRCGTSQYYYGESDNMG